VAAKLSEKSGRLIKPKDLHNLNAKECLPEMVELQRVIDEQIIEDEGVDNFSYILDDSGDEIYGAFYQNDHMRNIFQTYGTELFVDSTFNLNRNDFPCVVFAVADHNRQSRVVGFALVAYERQIIIDSVLEFFAKLNDMTILQAVMIDKDLKEDSAITKAFPQARVLYCNWHTEKTFRKRFNKTTADCAIQMMLAATETEFNRQLEKFRTLEEHNEKNLEYFESNWMNCVDKWAKFKRIGLPLNLQETNNPVEVLNKQLKAYASRHSSSSIGRCFKSIFLYIRTTELNKAAIAENERNRVLVLKHREPIVNEFFKYVSSAIANWLTSQFEKSKQNNYTYDQLKNEVSSEKNNYQLTDLNNNLATCSCYENSALSLPCRHLFFARNELALQMFNSDMVPQRHKLKQQLVQANKPSMSLFTKVPNMNTLKSLNSGKNMTGTSKYNNMFRVCQELCNNSKKVNRVQYEK
jgi:hypothetical protein